MVIISVLTQLSSQQSPFSNLHHFQKVQHALLRSSTCSSPIFLLERIQSSVDPESLVVWFILLVCIYIFFFFVFYLAYFFFFNVCIFGFCLFVFPRQQMFVIQLSKQLITTLFLLALSSFDYFYSSSSNFEKEKNYLYHTVKIHCSQKEHNQLLLILVELEFYSVPSWKLMGRTGR